MLYFFGVIQVQDFVVDVFVCVKGVCQDYIYVFFVCCCVLEILVCYVSGYVYSDNVQYVVMYVWVEVWFDGCWLLFDIINNICCLNQYLWLVIGLDYFDVCLVWGIWLGGGGEIMLINVEVCEYSQQVQQ